MTMDKPPIAKAVKKLDEILGFRVRGHMGVENGRGTIEGAQTEILQKLDDGRWMIRAVQPANPREFLMYTLLLEMWENDGQVRPETVETVMTSD